MNNPKGFLRKALCCANCAKCVMVDLGGSVWENDIYCYSHAMKKVFPIGVCDLFIPGDPSTVSIDQLMDLLNNIG